MSDIKVDLVDEILAKTNIVDVVSEFVPLSKRGKNYVGICPFHDDSNPSMYVSSDKKIYKCFSCGAGGNVINFVQDFQHISFVEALKFLGDRLGIDTNIKSTVKKKNVSDDIYEIVTKYYENSLFTNKGRDALKYLEKRNIDDKTIKEFRIGYAPLDDVVTKMLVSKNFSYDTLVDIGITTKTDYGYKDFFFNRIMFPIADIDNKIVAASGRIFNGEKTSKYVNTKETKEFKKGTMLYNYYQAKSYALYEKYVIITEGFFDVIRCHIAGFKNVVATMGTAFTSEHVKIIKKLSSNIILLFDGDQAGAKATFSCGNILMENGITPKVVRLPDNLDPDEYILKNGRESFKKLIDNPLSFIEFKLDYLKSNKDITKISDLSSYVNDVIDEVNKVSDDVTRDIMVDKVSQELGIDKSIITSRLKENNTKSNAYVEIKKHKQDKYDKACYKLLYYMLRSKDIILKYKTENIVLPNSDYRNLANEILYFYKKYGTINSVNLITQLDDKKKLINLVTDIESSEFSDDYNMDELDDCIALLKKYTIDMEIKKLQDELKNEIDVSRKTEIFEKLVELKKREL